MGSLGWVEVLEEAMERQVLQIDLELLVKLGTPLQTLVDLWQKFLEVEVVEKEED